MLRVFPILVSACLLAACGQKGPLFLTAMPAAATAGGAPAAPGSAAAPAPATTSPPVTGSASPVRGP